MILKKSCLRNENSHSSKFKELSSKLPPQTNMVSFTTQAEWQCIGGADERVLIRFQRLDTKIFTVEKYNNVL